MLPNPTPQPPQEPTEYLTESQYKSLQNELSGRVFRHVKHFHTKYFDDKFWSITAEQVAEEMQDAEARGQCMKFSEIRSHKEFSNWFALFYTMFLSKEEPIQHRFFCRPPYKPGNLLKPEIFLIEAELAHHRERFPRASMRVFGELKFNVSSAGPKDVLYLYNIARSILESTPMRRFLHGFQVCGSVMELWVFDRSGAYSSEMFDIGRRPDLFIKTLAGYVFMNDEEVGLEPFIKLDGLEHYVTFGGTDGTEAERFYLTGSPIARPLQVLGPGATCYKARRLPSEKAEFVVKLAWRGDKRSIESKILELTKARNVWGVVEILGSQDLGTIDDLRDGLEFTQVYDFQPAPLQPPTSSEATSLPSEMARPSSAGSELMFVNWTFSAMVIYPFGRPINKFESVVEFLEACRDIVKALRSLYRNGKILHRDISIKNLIITAPRNEGDPKGMLIDFDLAFNLEKGPPPRGQCVGTPPFMAIGIMMGNVHTYRHDLESFFYVFLWIAICNDREAHIRNSLQRRDGRSRLWGWALRDVAAVLRNKTRDMSEEGFEDLLREFSGPFLGLEGLAGTLHQLLFFPMSGAGVFLGTDWERGRMERLYRGFGEAFDRAIEEGRRG